KSVWAWEPRRAGKAEESSAVIGAVPLRIQRYQNSWPAELDRRRPDLPISGVGHTRVTKAVYSGVAVACILELRLLCLRPDCFWAGFVRSGLCGQAPA